MTGHMHTDRQGAGGPRPLAVRGRPAWLAALMVLLIAAAPAQGRVFRRWQAADAAVRTLEAAGGKRAYEAPVSINGVDGRVTVLGFDASLPAVMRTAAGRFGFTEATPPNATLAVRRIDGARGTLDLVAAEVSLGRTLVFVLESTDTTGAGAARPPDGLSLYPGATPAFSARDRRARLQFCLAATPAAAAGVRAYYRAELTAGGWTPLTGPGTADGLDVYLKPGGVCCVYAAPGRLGTDVALLRKGTDTPP